MTRKPAGARYELLVERHLSPATLATFPVALTITAVPRNRVRRLRVPGDRDLADVVRRLTDRSVQLLEIRRCPAPDDAVRRPATPRVVASPGLGTTDLIVFPSPPAATAAEPPAAARDRPATVTQLVPSSDGADVHAPRTMPRRSGERRVPRRQASAEWKEDRR